MHTNPLISFRIFLENLKYNFCFLNVQLHRGISFTRVFCESYDFLFAYHFYESPYKYIDNASI